MPESGFHRPRRAWTHDTDSDEPIAADDTPAASGGGARRGVDDELGDSGQRPLDPGTGPGDPGRPATPQANPFARPGSSHAGAAPPAVDHPVPAPVMPSRDFDAGDDSGHRTGESDGGPAAKPRRSAVSSATPGEPPTAATPAAAPQSWVRHHRGTLLVWGIGALVAALLIALGSFLVVRQGATDPDPSPTTSPSPSTSVSAVPVASVADLITLEDAEAIVPGVNWNVVNTAETSAEAKQKAACLSTFTTDVNATDTFQRALGTPSNGLAALHRIDVYANAGAARQVQRERAETVAACSEVPAHIRSSDTVTGLGDEVTQVTVALQGEEATTFHTVLLVRTGRALSTLDVTRDVERVEVTPAIAGLQRSLAELCTRADGMCPTDPVASLSVPPPVAPVGWLITSDLERMRPGFGVWNATDPQDITSQGMGCENLPLATEPGPVTRAQRTYLLTQDDATPSTFGIDEMVFDFEDNAAAQAFTQKLVGNLLSCKDRGSLTAQVSDGGAVNGIGADRVPVSARMITIDQAVSDDSSVRYQLVVAIADTRVSYLLASVTADYQFPAGPMKALALRTAQRNSQG